MKGVGGWVRVSGGGVKVGAEVTKGESEVGVGVEVGEREDMVLVEGWCGGGHEGGLCDFDLHCWEALWFVCWGRGCGDLWVVWLIGTRGQCLTKPRERERLTGVKLEGATWSML